MESWPLDDATYDARLTAVWHLPSGYVENLQPVSDLDWNDQRVWQPDVYLAAKRATDRSGLGRLVDIGCGDAGKLAAIHERHADWQLAGLDQHMSRSWTFSATWIAADLGRLGWERHINAKVGSPAIFVCADVVEHLLDPGPLLQDPRPICQRVSHRPGPL